MLIESLGGTPETYTTLFINYIPIKLDKRMNGWWLVLPRAPKKQVFAT